MLKLGYNLLSLRPDQYITTYNQFVEQLLKSVNLYDPATQEYVANCFSGSSPFGDPTNTMTLFDMLAGSLVSKAFPYVTICDSLLNPLNPVDTVYSRISSGIFGKDPVTSADSISLFKLLSDALYLDSLTISKRLQNLENKQIEIDVKLGKILESVKNDDTTLLDTLILLNTTFEHALTTSGMFGNMNANLLDISSKLSRGPLDIVKDVAQTLIPIPSA